MEVRILLMVLCSTSTCIFYMPLLPSAYINSDYLYMMQISINYVNMKIALNHSGWLQSQTFLVVQVQEYIFLLFIAYYCVNKGSMIFQVDENLVTAGLHTQNFSFCGKLSSKS